VDFLSLVFLSLSSMFLVFTLMTEVLSVLENGVVENKSVVFDLTVEASVVVVVRRGDVAWSNVTGGGVLTSKIVGSDREHP